MVAADEEAKLALEGVPIIMSLNWVAANEGTIEPTSGKVEGRSYSSESFTFAIMTWWRIYTTVLTNRMKKLKNSHCLNSLNNIQSYKETRSIPLANKYMTAHVPGMKQSFQLKMTDGKRVLWNIIFWHPRTFLVCGFQILDIESTWNL